MKKIKESEIWLLIPDYDYSISSYGRVRNNKTNHILHGKKNLSGYLQVALRKDGKQKWFLIHRLVAQLFTPNLFGGGEIDHIDGNRLNNHYENLRWCSSSENSLYIPKTKRRSPKGKRKRVLQKDLEGNIIREWNTSEEAARTLGYCSTCIRWCCQGRSKTYKNFLWEYVPEAHF
jgi:hypothetical protein